MRQIWSSTHESVSEYERKSEECVFGARKSSTGTFGSPLVFRKFFFARFRCDHFDPRVIIFFLIDLPALTRAGTVFACHSSRKPIPVRHMSTSQLDPFVFSRKRAPLYSFSCASYGLRECSAVRFAFCKRASHSFLISRTSFLHTRRHGMSLNFGSLPTTCSATSRSTSAMLSPRWFFLQCTTPRPGSPGSFASCASSPHPLVRSHLAGKWGFSLAASVCSGWFLQPSDREDNHFFLWPAPANVSVHIVRRLPLLSSVEAMTSCSYQLPTLL